MYNTDSEIESWTQRIIPYEHEQRNTEVKLVGFVDMSATPEQFMFR